MGLALSGLQRYEEVGILTGGHYSPPTIVCPKHVSLGNKDGNHFIERKSNQYDNFFLHLLKQRVYVSHATVRRFNAPDEEDIPLVGRQEKHKHPLVVRSCGVSAL